MAPAARVAALLLLLGVSYAAKVDPSRPTLMQLRDRWHKESSAPGKVSTASEHEEPHYGHELQEMEVCLVEVSRKACSSAGVAATPGPRDLRKLWTSEVACCNDGYGEQSYNSGYGAGLGDRLTALPSIGSCDWSAMLLAGDLISTGINRIGKASAVCYFSGDALSCGGPMCDKLVISLEGSVYTADTAYSHYPMANVNNADCQADTDWAGGRVAGPGAWMFNTGADGAAKVPGARAAEAQQAQQAQGANLENYGYGHDSYGRDDGYGDSYGHERAVYSGSATIINGIITAFAGQRKEKWDEGVFEYTPSFTGTTPITGAVNAAYPWVRDNTYKLTLYKHGSY